MSRSIGHRSLLLVLAAIGLASAGCMKSLWNGLADPTQLGHFGASPVLGEIRNTLTIHDEPPGIPGAEEPRPEDTVPRFENYRLAANDMVRVTIYELFGPQTPMTVEPRVSDVGEIYIFEVGYVNHVIGMTSRQLQDTIVARLEEQQILRNPLVEVSVLTQIDRTYTVDGSVPGPSMFQITRADLRLREALTVAGGVPQGGAREIYVVRKTSDAEPPPAGDAAPPALPPTLSVMGGGQAGPAAQPPAAPGTQPLTPEQAAKELLDAVSPVQSTQPGDAGVPATAPTPREALTTQVAPGLSRWQFIHGEWVEVAPSTAPAPGEPGAAPGPATTPEAPAGPETQPAVDWEALAEDSGQRIIRIPIDRLQRFDPRYNIVIRAGDYIWVPAGPIGEFYVTGHVNRPGPYTLTGRQVNLKQAIVAAGGLSILAWPSRCEVIRRVGENQEEIIPIDVSAIFDGQMEDFFLKPDDIINVGTNALAPFLATIRSAFRVSYGFGFVYDRNFADIDSFAGQQNPIDRRRFERQAQFPGLF